MNPEIQGFCDPRFAAVKDVFRDNFLRHGDIGASFSVMLAGEPVVDLWAGHADRQRTQPWQRDTLVCVFSSTKIPTALCLHILADEGKLDLNAPVADYWPEFAQQGKHQVRVRHLLSHSAGLPAFDGTMATHHLYDWDRITRQLAGQRPRWNAGSRTGYHAITYGYLNGEIVRRITGLSIGQYFQQRVAEPLGIDFHYGVPASQRVRMAELSFPREYPFSRVPMPIVRGASRVLGYLPQVFLNPIIRTCDTRSAEFLDAEIPGSNGHGNARSLARIGAIFAGKGTLDGQQVLTEAAILRATEPQSHGKDLVLNIPLSWGLGFALEKGAPHQHHYPRLHWNGYGGSHIHADLEHQLSLGYAMNLGAVGVNTDARAKRLKQAVYRSLGVS